MDVSIAITLLGSWQGHFQKNACFINLLKDCVGQAFFAKVLGGITQSRNCVPHQLSNTQSRRIEKTTTNCVFYQFTQGLRRPRPLRRLRRLRVL